jgi:hypothetical protein
VLVSGTVASNATGEIVNTASVRGDQSDPNPASSVAAAVVAVTPLPQPAPDPGPQPVSDRRPE